MTSACIALAMNLFFELDGYNEKSAVDYNDTDFCLRACESGYRDIDTPFATLYRFEGVAAKRKQPSTSDYAAFGKVWSRYINNDPNYSPLLMRSRYGFSLRDDR